MNVKSETPTPDPISNVPSPEGLLRRFVVLSAVSWVFIMLLAGLGVYGVFRDHLVDDATDATQATARAIIKQERSVIVGRMLDGSFLIHLDNEEAVAFDERMRSTLAIAGMVKVKLYNSDKRIVYSTDAAIIGRVDANNAALAGVFRDGKPNSRLALEGKLKDLHGEVLRDVDVVETYVPIFAKRKVIGVFEVYHDVSRAYAEFKTGVGVVLALLGLTLVAAYTGLYLTLRRGTRALTLLADRMHTLASTDMLTGLYNRRSLNSRIEEESARRLRSRGARSPDAIAFIMADIDLFKAVNDTRGHQAGDEVLRQVARRMKACLRPHDVIGRYGGEEFLVMLPHTDLEGAVACAERMRLAIAVTPIEVEGGGIAVTASFGVSQSCTDQESFEAAIGRADAALYEAKAAGRNRVVSAA